MTYEEARKDLFHLYANADCVDFADSEIDALAMAIEALEKQIPKKAVRKVVNRGFNLPMPTNIYVCPICGVDTPVPRSLETWEFWCPDCGQRIDWSET